MEPSGSAQGFRKRRCAIPTGACRCALRAPAAIGAAGFPAMTSATLLGPMVEEPGFAPAEAAELGTEGTSREVFHLALEPAAPRYDGGPATRRSL